jgi:hypothetical protein
MIYKYDLWVLPFSAHFCKFDGVIIDLASPIFLLQFVRLAEIMSSKLTIGYILSLCDR